MNIALVQDGGKFISLGVHQTGNSGVKVIIVIRWVRDGIYGIVKFA